MTAATWTAAQEKAALRSSPAQDVLQLTTSLAKAGWGEYFAQPAFRGARVILRELACVMYAARKGRSAAIDITAPQLQDRTGYCERWVRESLNALEGLGLIEWNRGGIVEGSPRPSVIRIVKQVLADFVYTARVWHDEVLDARVLVTKARLKATLRWRFCKGRKNRRDAHAEVTASLPLFEGRKSAPTGGTRSVLPSLKQVIPPENSKETDHMSSFPDPEFMPLVCAHGATAPRFCNACRSEAWQEQAAAEKERQRLARDKAADAARKEAEQAALPTPFDVYMRETYPNASRAEAARLALQDPKARELAKAVQS